MTMGRGAGQEARTIRVRLLKVVEHAQQRHDGGGARVHADVHPQGALAARHPRRARMVHHPVRHRLPIQPLGRRGARVREAGSRLLPLLQTAHRRQSRLRTVLPQAAVEEDGQSGQCGRHLRLLRPQPLLVHGQRLLPSPRAPQCGDERVVHHQVRLAVHLHPTHISPHSHTTVSRRVLRGLMPTVRRLSACCDAGGGFEQRALGEGVGS